MVRYSLTKRNVIAVEYLLMLFFSLVPLLLELPYRVNIYLTWEGAYRMYLGQMPFRDFGLPLGYGFWLIPTIFFHLFGPIFLSLVIAQAFINFCSFVLLNQLLKIFDFSPVQRLLALVVFGLSFVIVNFWPWYNHTAFVFELAGLYFLCEYLFRGKGLIYAILSAAFIALCFFTKQDAGGLSLVLCLALLGSFFLQTRTIKKPVYFIAFYAVFLGLLIIPLLGYDFKYWFNAGQHPHYSRINAYDFVSAFFSESLWIKFYLFALVVILLIRYKTIKEFIADSSFFNLTILTAGILVQALLIQVTSFSPVTVNYYFHTFGFGFIIFSLKDAIKFERLGIAVLLLIAIFVWRSDQYWKYADRILAKAIPAVFAPAPENVVSKNSWSAKDSTANKPVIWQNTSYKTLRKIKLPQNTVDGIRSLIKLKDSLGYKNPSVLNMSNLTFLAYELGYTPERGPNIPLWYHKGVAFFDREEQLLCKKIQDGVYDIVLFEDMPDVDNFFPYGVRECLIENKYVLVSKFISPTGYVTDSVEVYTRPEFTGNRILP